jgi:ribosomal protein S18 acetylase RimI-like enzyme
MLEATLGVKSANPTGALCLYEGMGFRVVLRQSSYRKPLQQPLGCRASTL